MPLFEMLSLEMSLIFCAVNVVVTVLFQLVYSEVSECDRRKALCFQCVPILSTLGFLSTLK